MHDPLYCYPNMLTVPSRFDVVIVVCFVGGMLYYSMNVIWPRQSQALFVGPEDPIMRGVYAMIFSCGTWSTCFTLNIPITTFVLTVSQPLAS
jgi:hypothetical protein